MICEHTAHKFCKDDISKIENYEKAITDTTQTWHCHHRLEFTLDGEFAHSAKELMRLGMYYQRPYFELIFLTPSEHMSLHMKDSLGPMKGLKCSFEHRKKISESLKGKRLADARRQKISATLKGKTNKVMNECKNAYRQYKSNGGTMTWNEFQSSFKATESEI